MTTTAENLERLPVGRYPQFKKGEWQDVDDVVSREVAVELVLRGGGESVRRTLWAHPDDLEHLAVGHAALEMCAEGQKPVLAERRDGEFLLDAVAKGDPGPEPEGPRGVSGPELLAAMDELFGEGGLWEATGCFHRIGLWDPQAKKLVRMAQDIGRHNCIDRLAGWALAQGVDPREYVLVCSARLTASLAGKARTLGVRLAVSRSAVTTGALEVAAAGAPQMSVVGFAREGRLTVFSDPDGRVVR